MSNIVEAEYEIVQERTLPVIISEIKIIEQHVTKTAIEGAIQIGERLQEAKQLAGHGNFGQWCQENLNYSQDTAQKFMKLAREYGGQNNVLANTAMSRNFSISNALSLLKVPEEDRKQFVEEHPVEDMTNKALEDEIRKLKEEKDLDEEKIRMLRDDLDKERESVIDAYDRERAAKEEAAHALQKIEDLKRQLDDATSAQADPEEIAKLQEQLQKVEQKLQKSKEDLKKEKDKLKVEKDLRQAAIDKELEAQSAKLKDEAKKEVDAVIADLQSMKDQLEEENRSLQHKLENAENDTIIRFKMLVDQLQETFEACGNCILDAEAGTDPELPTKMNTVLKTVVESFEAAL